MGLLELIKNIGEERISVQCINNCFISVKSKRSEETEISLLTTEITPDELAKNKGKVGLIIWIDRDDAIKNGL